MPKDQWKRETTRLRGREAAHNERVHNASKHGCVLAVGTNVLLPSGTEGCDSNDHQMAMADKRKVLARQGRFRVSRLG